jgi:membrane peptidoglycan carboxypeptidase
MTIGDATSENVTRAYHEAAVSERRGSVRSTAPAVPRGTIRPHRLGPAVAGVVALALLAQGCRIPDLKDVQAGARRLPQTSFLYADNGSLVTTFHAEQNRVSVPFEDIPKVVRDAVIAIEDQRFYDHEGIDLKALIRAAYIDATSGKVVEGGSTITEQYIKNRYLGPEQTLSRKLKEAALAWQLEHELSKDAILTRYLNTVYFGDGAYGIQAAARTYFSEPATALDLPQAATIAGLIAAPSAYDPLVHPLRALDRRNRVLASMRGLDDISEADYFAAVQSPLGLYPSKTADRYFAPYFVQFVKDWFTSNPAFGPTRADREALLYEGGVRIYTTLDPALQRDAQNAVNQVLVYRTDPYGAMTVIDPKTGEIKAMVGGRNYFSQHDPVAEVNLATGGVTGRQAGSSFKPFALVAALENGIPPQQTYSAPSSIQIPLPDACQAPGQPVWNVQNYDGGAAGTIDLETATIDSVNVVYAQLVQQLGAGDACAGAAKVVAVARRLGLDAPELTRMGVGVPLAPVPAAVLGAEQVNTVEMASAYGTLATIGYRVPPIPVIRVTDAQGKVLWRADPRPKLVVDPGIAWVTDQILQKVVQFGTGAAANIGRPAIGKTGTAQQYRDAWFVGAIPQLVAAVWVGFPRGEIPMVAPRTRLPAVLGGTWPAQIWNLFMSKAAENVPVLDFQQPQVRYVTVAIDSSRGCLANEYTPPYLIQRVRYLDGTQPTERCTEPSSYQKLPVPSVVGVTLGDATAILRGAGFGVQVVATTSDQPAGTVVGQDPVAGEEALQSSVVTITVSGPIPVATPSPTPTASPAVLVVPDVVGLSQGDAVGVLQAAGFGVAVVQESKCASASSTCHRAPGLVWKERPDPESEVQQGTAVTIYVEP